MHEPIPFFVYLKWARLWKCWNLLMAHNFRGVPSLLLNTLRWLRVFRRYDNCQKLKVKQGFQHMGNSKCANMKVTTPVTKYSVYHFWKSWHKYIWVLILKWIWFLQHEYKCWIWYKWQALNGRTYKTCSLFLGEITVKFL